MATIAEYREFFFRSTQVTTGSRPDKETGFPTTYALNGVLVGNRLLKSHYPNEAVFKKLAQSVTFKLNSEDTASATQQGLTKTGTDAEVIAKTASFSDTLTRCVQPYQLPDVEENDTMDVNNASTDDGVSGIVVTSETYTLPSSTKTRKRYLVRKKDSFYKTFTNLVSVLTNATTLWTKIIPLKAFSTNGDTILVDVDANVNNINTNSKAVKLYINSTLIAVIDIAGAGDLLGLLRVKIVKQSHGTDSVVLVSYEQQYIDGTFTPTTRVLAIGNVVTLTGVNLSTTTMSLVLTGICANIADVVTVSESSIKFERY